MKKPAVPGLRTAAKIGIAVLVILLTYVVNRHLIDVRIWELSYLLDQAAKDRFTGNTLGIVTRYDLIRRRIETGEGDIGSYEAEARMRALTVGEPFFMKAEVQEQVPAAHPSVVFVLVLGPLLEADGAARQLAARYEDGWRRWRGVGKPTIGCL